MSMKLSDAQHKALIDLRENGCEGAISKTGSLVAGGVRLPYLADTWLRLMTTGHVEPRGPMRLGLTDLGKSEAVPAPRKVAPSTIHAPMPGTAMQPGAE